MTNNKSSGASNGISFSGLLTIVFVTLKLLNKIDWPWVWVLSPLWITVAILLVLLLIVIIIVIVLDDQR